MSKAAPRRWPELLIADWPALDRAALEVAIRPPGILRKGGPASEYAPTTLRTMRSLYGGLLYWARARGELDPSIGPAERVTMKFFTEYVRARSETVSPNTVYNNVGMLALLMKCLAPDLDWSWIGKHRDRPTKQQAADARRPIRVVDLGKMFKELLDRLDAARQVTPDLDAALRMRDLLLVAVCTCTALRLSNLKSPRLGTTISRTDSCFELRYSMQAVKNHRQLTLAVMDELTPYLDAYIADFRPVLVSRRCDNQREDALWLSWSGRPLNNVAVQTAFKNVTTEVQGWPANPHSFRHSAATILMRLDVRMVEFAAQVLAHRGLDTVHGHYDLSKNDAADRQWRELRNRYISPQGDSP